MCTGGPREVLSRRDDATARHSLYLCRWSGIRCVYPWRSEREVSRAGALQELDLTLPRLQVLALPAPPVDAAKGLRSLRLVATPRHTKTETVQIHPFFL